MPHQCVRCGALYDDGDETILKGCSCGGKLFFYIKKEKLDAMQKITSDLSEEEKKQIEKDVFEVLGIPSEQEEPVVLDLESIRVLKPGKYEIDLVHLFKKEPLVFKIGDGKYIIDLLSAFSKEKKEK